MKVIIDRFEDNNIVVCEKEDRTMIHIFKDELPSEAKEGDVLNIENDKITLDTEEIAKRKEEIEELTKDLWN